MDDILAEQRRELEQFGNPPRFDIRMFPLLGEEKPTGGILISAVTPHHRRVTNAIGEQFRRELRFDFAPSTSMIRNPWASCSTPNGPGNPSHCGWRGGPRTRG